MRPALLIAIRATAPFAGPALCEALIKPTIAFNDMRVVVTYVSTGD
jgi:hypothetical protein